MSLLTSGEDLLAPRANACVVFGLGSSAFARLLEENRASSPELFVALKKHSWGFAGISGGAQRVDAWEAVVWGARSYCVFVLASPVAAPQSPTVSFEGMAGFIKAVFRWNAPQGVGLTIGELGAPRALVRYTGMMGVAPLLLSRTVTEKAAVAGLSAFASATTNNVSVSVDFSSWIMSASGTPLILALLGQI